MHYFIFDEYFEVTENSIPLQSDFILLPSVSPAGDIDIIVFSYVYAPNEFLADLCFSYHTCNKLRAFTFGPESIHGKLIFTEFRYLQYLDYKSLKRYM